MVLEVLLEFRMCSKNGVIAPSCTAVLVVLALFLGSFKDTRCYPTLKKTSKCSTRVRSIPVIETAFSWKKKNTEGKRKLRHKLPHFGAASGSGGVLMNEWLAALLNTADIVIWKGCGALTFVRSSRETVLLQALRQSVNDPESFEHRVSVKTYENVFPVKTKQSTKNFDIKLMKLSFASQHKVEACGDHMRYRGL